MSHSITTTPDWGYLTTELSCYLQSDVIAVTLAGMQTLEYEYNAQYIARQYQYELPLGTLQLLELTLYLPFDTASADINAVRMIAVKSALAWYKASLSQNKDSHSVSYDALVFDIQLVGGGNNVAHDNNEVKTPNVPQRLNHYFGARYFLEDLVVDINESMQQLQVFSWQDWHSIAAAVQTPCELWRFLAYHLEQLKQSATSYIPSFESEEMLVTQFLQSPDLFTSAIEVDNALIKNEAQDEPNSALIAMALAYKNQSKTAQMYHRHMEQAATLWSQLSMQMIESYGEKQKASNEDQLDIPLSRWQQQLLDESLFSRHELVRTLYRYPKQNEVLRNKGYVVHQHSYESLGRHYVMIFYGQDSAAQHSKGAIQPNLAKIAQDVATRLPIIELHHVVVLGIDFVTEGTESFMDIDLWIQSVDTMTQRERQLTKKLQQLKQTSAQTPDQSSNQKLEAQRQTEKLPQVRLNLSIPAKKDN
ncbi:hypothetical protein [Psychrobacter sp. NG27]|uniref:hypothetical protein n=1 Tax=Psychrobacter sp. NG27 TaxID=2781966 RepID=UPI0018DF99D2|nr:hypothetical protein [Psychrobacter sp. NG27]MBI0427100.1 hypothetical protein [Psychrobacter sp. NG27]